MKGDVVMFNKQIRANIKKIDEMIDIQLKLSEVAEVGSDEHQACMKQIKELTELRTRLAESKVSERLFDKVKLSPDVLVSGAISVASILIILKYEEKDVITSKAFGLATKLFRG